MQISEHFSLSEIIHPDILKTVGNRSINFINPNLIIVLEQLRKIVDGPVTINGTWQGQEYTNSGLRSTKHPLNGKANYSAHYYGNAADCKFDGSNVLQLFEHILSNQDDFPLIYRMENIDHTPTWLHVEVGPGEREGNIGIFNV